MIQETEECRVRLEKHNREEEISKGSAVSVHANNEAVLLFTDLSDCLIPRQADTDKQNHQKVIISVHQQKREKSEKVTLKSLCYAEKQRLSFKKNPHLNSAHF